MCVLCVITNKKTKAESVARTAVRAMYENIAIGMMDPIITNDFKMFYMGVLLDTAKLISQGVKDSFDIDEASILRRTEVAPMQAEVDKIMQSKDAEYYTSYGIVMPPEMRQVVLSRVWEEQESKAAAEKSRRKTDNEPATQIH